MTAGAPGSPWINAGALENSSGAAAGKCQSITPKAADEERQVVSNAGGLQNLQYLQSLLNSAGGISLMVSWMMLQDP